jgi:ParB family chromosome partitioning protein
MNMAKKNALGRGLGALIDGVEKEVLEQKVEANREIAVDSIEANPFQPRTSFDEQSLEELSVSIRKLGIVQPLTVRETTPGHYQLIAGERRLRAARLAGLTHVPAYIRTADDQAMLELALVENIQREDLDAVEVAISFQRLIEECNLTQEQLSDRVGKQRPTVANYLRLLKLPAEIQLGIRNKQLMMGHARTLVNIEDPKKQIKVYYKIVDGELSVRQAEDLVRHLQSEETRDPSKIEKKKKLNEDFAKLSEHLNKIFSAKVNFRINEKGKGKIVIPFENPEDMERILGVFDRLNS